ncbi:GAF domain-containing protein [Streptacidiphilus sp. N1-12]|uniref:GAF domain-containing protein n=2 Tax=Streptacidiphilus alkalitolerans TaxID=3342712 RepID=A0ABV6WKG7_9ACTN
MGGNGGWLARVGADPQARAREIGHAHSAFVATHQLAAGGGTGLREVVAQSWLRSSDARVDQAVDPPVTLTDGDLAAYREAHPLARVIDVLRQIVGTAADDGDHLMAVSDASGRLLWVEGNRAARARAARINFVEGALWDEAHAGTNAPGTALALDHEVQIFATEHFRQPVQDWTCAAAPIHDPATGRILGVIDVTGGDIVANPHSLALVRAAARACEAALWLPGERPDLGVPVLTAAPTVREGARLRALGRPEGLLILADGGEIRLTRRHTELLIMLMLHQDGLTGEQLSDLLYQAPANPTTLRVELARLRRVVGGLVASRPYRLTAPLRADFLDVAAALHRGDLPAALAGYSGPLLPSSEAPAVCSHRRWLDTRLRAAVLASTRPETVRAWADGPGFNDLQVWERLAAIAPNGSPCRGVALARRGELRAEWGLV